MAVPGPLSKQYRAITAAILALVTVVAFEAMAVSTAMPQVTRDLHAVRGYGLAFSAMLTAQLLGIVLAGVWTDRRGPLRGTFAGQLLVAGGSAICGFATHYWIFLVGRVVTGLGGGLLLVMLYVIAARAYPEAIRPRLFTLVSAAWVLPSLAGPSIAAWLTGSFSWRWVFWVVVPPTLATFAYFLRARRVVETGSLGTAVSHRDEQSHAKAAWAGLGLAIAAGAVQYGTTNGNKEWGWPDLIAALGLVGVLLTAPRLVPAGTWQMTRGLPSVMLSRALLAGAFYAGISYVPLLVVSVHHRSLLTAGALVAIGSFGWAAGAWWQGHARLAGPRDRLVLVGGIFTTLGLAGIGLIVALGLPWWLHAVPLILCGLGMGIGVTTTTILALSLVSEEEHGETSSGIQIADVLGSVLGIAAATGAFAIWHSPQNDRWLFATIFLVLAAVAALVVPAAQRIRT